MITSTVARHVLFHFGLPGGMEAGDFTKSLIAAITRADPPNRRLLTLGFPGYVEAVDLAQNALDGALVLQVLADGDVPSASSPAAIHAEPSAERDIADLNALDQADELGLDDPDMEPDGRPGDQS